MLANPVVYKTWFLTSNPVERWSQQITFLFLGCGCPWYIYIIYMYISMGGRSGKKHTHTHTHTHIYICIYTQYILIVNMFLEPVSAIFWIPDPHRPSLAGPSLYVVAPISMTLKMCDFNDYTR